jgi:hypothetical protein
MKARGPARHDPDRARSAAAMTTYKAAFRGNKAALPSKPCMACGRPMSWRRSWAKNWEQVKFCSAGCRRAKAPGG